MGFLKHESWSRFPFPSPGDLPDPGIKLASPVSPTLAGKKSPPAMQETQESWVQFLGQEDPLEKEMATHSRILA